MINIKKLIIACLVITPILALAKDYKGAEIYAPDSKAVTYGRFEMRMMAAKGSGTLSTFFLYKNGSEKGIYPWEEVDIEIKGKDNADVWQSNIITGMKGSQHSEELHGTGGFADKFHTFTIEWTPGKVVWKVDGVVTRTSEGGQTDLLTSPMSNRFNLWAATSVDWVGTFEPETLPIYQYVSWFSYDSYTPGAGPNGTDFTPAWRDEFNTFDTSRWAKANWTFKENRTDFDPKNVVVKDGMLILCMTTADKTGFKGTVPSDIDDPTAVSKE
ncbi:MAG: family 16 glycosylhydrolase [Colwelliaceae bacterium]|jgi:beta-glucanase (GH16 family)|nr:family 16 glycosylhydrolase [Colwelliaceae bacterium]